MQVVPAEEFTQFSELSGVWRSSTFTDGNLSDDDKVPINRFSAEVYVVPRSSYPVTRVQRLFGMRNAVEAVEETVGLIRQASAIIILAAATLWLQAAGMAVLIRWARVAIAQGFSLKKLSAWHSAVLINRFIGVIIVLHIFEILLWAGFYRWQCLPTWESCFYFSAASFSTVGYGDIVLPRMWRELGPLESVIGVIMCGISVSALFAIAIRLIESEDESSITHRPNDVSAAVPELVDNR